MKCNVGIILEFGGKDYEFKEYRYKNIRRFSTLLYILKGGETVSDKLTLSAVVGLFTTKVITLEKAAELTGKSIWDFIDILKVYGIPWGEYEEDDMDMDDVFLSKLGE